MHFELWDLETRNLVGEYDTEEEALEDVRRALAAGWPVEHLALGKEFGDDDIGDDELLGPTVSGVELADLAMSRGASAPNVQQRSA